MRNDGCNRGVGMAGLGKRPLVGGGSRGVELEGLGEEEKGIGGGS